MGSLASRILAELIGISLLPNCPLRLFMVRTSMSAFCWLRQLRAISRGDLLRGVEALQTVRMGIVALG